MLRHYEEYSIVDKKDRVHEMRTICFCPIGNSNFNSIYKGLKTIDHEKDVILDYSDDKLLKVLDEIAQELVFYELSSARTVESWGGRNLV